MENINTKLNEGLIELSLWLNTNVAWNVVNTDIMPFNINGKTLDAKGKLNLCRKQLHLPKL